MKIGIFGCSADPFTKAHLAIVTYASKRYDKVIIVPTTCDYYRRDKSPIFSFDSKKCCWFCGSSLKKPQSMDEVNKHLDGLLKE